MEHKEKNKVAICLPHLLGSHRRSSHFPRVSIFHRYTHKKKQRGPHALHQLSPKRFGLRDVGPLLCPQGRGSCYSHCISHQIFGSIFFWFWGEFSPSLIYFTVLWWVFLFWCLWDCRCFCSHIGNARHMFGFIFLDIRFSDQYFWFWWFWFDV
jgi:hypothetical protein